MAFTIDLYTCADDPKKVDKTLTLVKEVVNCRPTEELQILNPTFVLDYSESLLSANYAYCPLFKRYYFLEDPSVEIGKKIVYNAVVDPLMSWKDGLLSTTQRIVRQEKGQVSQYNDSQLPMKAGTTTEQLVFEGGPFTDGASYGGGINYMLEYVGDYSLTSGGENE